MARCGCSQDTCGCQVVAGSGIVVTGTGTAANPIVVSATGTAAPSGGTGGTSGDSRLPGEIIDYAGSAPPSSSWLICDGRAVSRTVYSTLFGVCGVAYGAGDGITTFNLPPSAGHVTLGADGSHGRGSTGGSESHALLAANLPPHQHRIDHDHPAFTTQPGGGHTHAIEFSTAAGGSGTHVPLGTTDLNRPSDAAVLSSTHTHSIDVPPYVGTSDNGTGLSGTPLNTMPPYVALLRLIHV